jgi:hypothetical protein
MGAVLSTWGGSLLWRAEATPHSRRVRAWAIVAIVAGLALGLAGTNLWRAWGGWGVSGFAWITPWHTAGFTLAVALLGLAARGLYGDPARGRARCPRCWYDMSGGGPVCPECGRRIASPARLSRRRRWWRLVSIAALGLVVVVPGLMSVPRVQRAGWRGLVPTTVLIAGLPWLPDMLVVSDGLARGTLRDRMRSPDRCMWEWQHRWARARAAGLMLRDPRSDAFRRGHAVVYCPDVDRARFAPLFLGWLTSDEAALRRAAARIDWCWDMLVVSPDYSPSAPEVGPFIPALLPRLEDEDLSVRRLAALLLMGRPDHAEIIVPALIHAAERRDEGGAVAVRSLNWYAHVSPEAVRWVVNALESDAPFMKDGVARAIVMLPPHSPPGQTLARSPEFRLAVVAHNGSEGSKLLSWLRHAVRDGASDPR